MHKKRLYTYLSSQQTKIIWFPIEFWNKVIWILLHVVYCKVLTVDKKWVAEWMNRFSILQEPCILFAVQLMNWINYIKQGIAQCCQFQHVWSVVSQRKLVEFFGQGCVIWRLTKEQTYLVFLYWKAGVDFSKDIYFYTHTHIDYPKWHLHKQWKRKFSWNFVMMIMMLLHDKLF